MKSLQTGLLVFAATLSLSALAGEKAQRVEETYPGLLPGALTYAFLGELPEGVLLESGTVQATAKELQEALEKAPALVKDEMKKNAPFALEQMVTGRLLLEVAKKSAADLKIDIAGKSDNDAVRDYFDAVVSEIKVAEGEAKDFYDRNLAICGDTPFEKMKGELEAYLLQQKKEAAVLAHIRTLGERVEITVSAAWLKEQVPLARDNPVDKARFDGRPTFVDFGGKSCCGPDTMLPVIEAVEAKYQDKLVVLYIETKENAVLAARYGVNAIPAQVLFDKDGKEVFRHSGIMSEEDIAERLKAVGIK